MTFEEWADILDLRAGKYTKYLPADKTAWYCDGPCGQLMYGQWHEKGWNYPYPSNMPIGSFISPEYSRVCDVCYALHDNIKNRSYWVALQASDRKMIGKLGSGGSYLAT